MFLNFFAIRQKGFSIIGVKCVVKTMNQKVFKKYSKIFVILASKIVSCKICKQSGINGKQLLKFLQIILKDKKNKIIILDNDSNHKNEKVKKLINKNNLLLYLVPYPQKV